MDFLARCAVVLSLSVVITACGSRPGNGTHGDAGPGSDGAAGPDADNGPFGDFPPGPIVDNSGSGPAVPTNVATLFGAAGTGTATGAPCLAEPELGSLFPLNGLRPRFNVIPSGTQNVFELRMHADNEINDLVVYTNNPIWVLPTATWTELNTHIVDQPITITVRAATTDGTTLTTPVTITPTGTVTIAPVSADGAIVYWTPSDGTPPMGALKGFSYGDETVASVLTPAQSGTGCIGCHAATPDGLFTAYSARTVIDGAGQANETQIMFRSVDGNATAPTFVSTSAATLLAREEQEMPMFSPAHWQAGDMTMLTVSPSLAGNPKWDLYWTDVQATSTVQGTGWGAIAHTGDTDSVANATFSHDGKSIVYVSESDPGAGVLPEHGDLYTVPYNNRMGGAATKLAGASDPTINEFYPTYSPDDQLIGFTAFPIAAGSASGDSSSYANPLNEVFVVPAAGGTATRLAANDPPTCGGFPTSPGLTNSWPKWSPNAQTVGDKTYYWLAFSSQRLASTNRQLYVTAIVVENGVISTFPSFYLWNQPAEENNHTPAWDLFQLPIQ